MAPYIFTSKIGKWHGPNGLDITVKGQDLLGKIFAPTWDMVMGLKQNSISRENYLVLYNQILAQIPHKHPNKLRQILNMNTVVLLCYCNHWAFCHRNIAADWLVREYGALKNDQTYIES
jgi:uncharacterized protein YeaO (DUF488 family)